MGKFFFFKIEEFLLEWTFLKFYKPMINLRDSSCWDFDDEIQTPKGGTLKIELLSNQFKSGLLRLKMRQWSLKISLNFHAIMNDFMTLSRFSTNLWERVFSSYMLYFSGWPGDKYQSFPLERLLLWHREVPWGRGRDRDTRISIGCWRKYWSLLVIQVFRNILTEY